MSCLDENKILALVEGLLSNKEAEEAERHIAGCSECRLLLSAYGEIKTRGTTGAAPPGLVGHVLQETYRVEELIGRGGMSLVYKASHLRLQRPFAVKVLATAAAENSEALARFRREAEITSKLAHPHIVQVVDFNSLPDDSPYLVMEYLEGYDLAQLLARGQTFPLALITTILKQATSALGAAHALGVVHRDLKPSNIFLCRQDAKHDFVKIMDFGISKVLGLSSQLTSRVAVMGSPSYMAPEQADARLASVDQRADVFALGAVLYRLLVGRVPFSGESVPQILYEVVHRDVEPFLAQRPDLPLGIEQVVLRALAKRPDDRYPSMDALWRDFARHAHFDAAEAEPCPEEEEQVNAAPLPVAHSRSTGQPRRTRQVAYGAVATLLVVAAFLVLWMHGRSSRAPREIQPIRAIRAHVAGITAGADAGREAGPRAVGLHEPALREPALREPALREPALHEPALRQARALALHPLLRKRPHRPLGHGSLAVQTTSARDGGFLWADVLLDGRVVGRTALTLKGVPAGAHLIEVRREGYQRQRRRIVLKREQRLPVHFELAPLR